MESDERGTNGWLEYFRMNGRIMSGVQFFLSPIKTLAFEWITKERRYSMDIPKFLFAEMIFINFPDV